MIELTPILGDDAVLEHLDEDRARELLLEALQLGFDPAQDPPRANVPAGAGHLLLMPTTIGEWTGVKIASVAPGNPDLGLPRIQALYQLMDSKTLTVRAIMSASLLTALRTPATSAIAAMYLADEAAKKLVVLGSGPQAIGHVRALAKIRELDDIVLRGRNAERLQVAVDTLVSEGYPVYGQLLEAGEIADVSGADMVVCATSAKDPVIAGETVKDGACVLAIGSHEPDRRELDQHLMGRSMVVVEDRATALREAGDVVQACQVGTLNSDDLVPLRNLVLGDVLRASDRPNIFKGVGMSWQDLAVAIGVARGCGIDPK